VIPQKSDADDLNADNGKIALTREPTMTTNEEGRQIPEAVGVFGDADSMQHAIEDLLSSGLDRGEPSLLASEETVDEKLGHKYNNVAEIEDDATVLRTVNVSPETIGNANAALIGGLAFIENFGAAGAIVASGGALAAIITGAALGAAIWGLLGDFLAKLIGDNHARYIQEQLKHGGLQLLVCCLNSECERSAMEILSRHSGRDVHVHVLPAPV
jgi:hypothetical protein